MKDAVLLTATGKTIGFTIQPEILKELDLDLNNLARIEIFKEHEGKKSLIMTQSIRNTGGSKGVSIRYYVVQKLDLKAGDVLEVDISKVEGT